MNLSDTEHKAKTGVSAVEIICQSFLSLNFSVVKYETALILQSVTSQEILKNKDREYLSGSQIEKLKKVEKSWMEKLS